MSVSCTTCGHANPDQAKFCLDCGAPITFACAKCSTPLPTAAKFCLECGTPVASVPPSPAPRTYTPKHLTDKILASKSALEGERKQVTVLFADVKSSMELSAAVGEEAWHGILERYFEIVTEAVHRFEGTVNQYTGDGIMALFGAPIAHEDHVQRACYAALHLRDGLRAFAHELRRTRGLAFETRIGLNSGDVVVGRIGDDLRMDYTAQGHTVGLAQRMEQLAEAGHIYLAPETAKRAAGYFALANLGNFQIKGVAEPVRVAELEGVGRLRTRFDVSRQRGLSKFVGRAAEIAALDAALERAIAGQGGVIGIVAEAGTGKSRLCFEFVERCRARGFAVRQTAAPSHGRNIPLTPILELFRGYFGVSAADDPVEVREKVAGRLLLLDERFREALPFVFDFLGVSDANVPLPQVEDAARQRQLYAVLRRLLERATAERPAVTVIEDLHWIDESSERWLAEWVDAVQDCHALLIVNFRPEYRAEWIHRAHYQQLALQPLDAATFRELLTDLLGRDSSIDGLAVAIHERTAGVPFFAEEMVQALIESGQLAGTPGAYRLAVPVTGTAVPDTVQAVLAARIDRLGDVEKQLLQTAAVIGKEFGERLLVAVMERPAATLAPHLAALERGEFIRTEAVYPTATYSFKHPLTQEVALRTQLAERRRQLHATVARAIEASTPAEQPDNVAAVLAHHWEEAGDALTAMRWHARAADSARLAAGGVWYTEEVRPHWAAVRRLCNSMDASDAASTLGLEACFRLLQWFASRSEASPLVESLLAEGRRHAARTGDRFGLFELLEAQAMVASTTLDPDIATLRSAVEEMHAIARASADPSLEWLADFRDFMFAQFGGDLRRAERLSDAMPERVERPSRLWSSGSIPIFLAHRARLRAQLGRLADAERDIEEAMRVYETAGFVHTFWLSIRVEVAVARGDLAAAAHPVETGQRVAALRVESIHQRFQSGYAAGLVRASAQHWEDAVSAFALVAESTLSWYRDIAEVRLAEAKSELGDSAAARSILDAAITRQVRRGARFFELLAQIARARVLRRAESLAAREPIEVALGRAEELLEATGARLYAPDILVERAELCALLGDGAGRVRHLRDAERAFLDMGAPLRAAKITALLSGGSLQ